jgi:putative endonuclease
MTESFRHGVCSFFLGPATLASMREYHFYVYILSSKSRTIYVGLTNNLFSRVMEHRAAKFGSYTARYRITRLVYVEKYKYINDAIAREKQLKDWRRERKVALIDADNPTWDDLANGWDEWQERVRRQAHGLSVAVLDAVRLPTQFGTADPSASLRDDSIGVLEQPSSKEESAMADATLLTPSRRIAHSILKQ